MADTDDVQPEQPAEPAPVAEPVPPPPEQPAYVAPPAGYGAYPPGTVVEVAYGPAPLGLRRSAGLVALLTIVTCGVWSIIWSYQVGNELQRYRGKGLGGVLYLLFTAFISPVTMFLLPGEIEEAYNEQGEPSPVSYLTGLWFLLPLAGMIVWYFKTQAALNNYWTMLGQTNDPGL